MSLSKTTFSPHTKGMFPFFFFSSLFCSEGKCGITFVQVVSVFPCRSVGGTSGRNGPKGCTGCVRFRYNSSHLTSCDIYLLYVFIFNIVLAALVISLFSACHPSNLPTPNISTGDRPGRWVALAFEKKKKSQE